jgi:Na+/H+ antiporter
MELILPYVILFAIIVLLGQLFDKSTIPLSLVLVIAGMVLGFVPNFPRINYHPEVILNVFLPLLIYQISAFSSWIDVKNNLKPIALLSIGHVIFITILVAVVIHTINPAFGWPLSFILGAVISPPDDVAIVSIAQKIRLPDKVLTILEGEGIFNDATALILFKFALAALITQEFSIFKATFSFFFLLLGEIAYGFFIGVLIGRLRSHIRNPILHVIASLITPFIAYFPMVAIGSSGVISTSIVGFIISNHYVLRFSSDFRLLSRNIWPTLAFAIESLIFVAVGLNMRNIVESIAIDKGRILFLYTIAVILTVIIGRFIWVYGVQFYWYINKVYFNKSSKGGWDYPFLISWSGMRGGISLAAALAVPALPLMANGVDPKNLLIFLVFNVILVTLVIQGLLLPTVIRWLGIAKLGAKQKFKTHVLELQTRLEMDEAVIKWLDEYIPTIKNDPALLDKAVAAKKDYEERRMNLQGRIKRHLTRKHHSYKKELSDDVFLLQEIIQVERNTLLTLWREEKITLEIRNKILDQLDHKTLYFGA